MKELNSALVVVAVVAVLFALSSRQGVPAFAQGMTPAIQATASSTAAQLTECFAAKLWVENGEAVSAGRIPKTVKIPPGWVVGGTTSTFTPTGTSPVPAAVLCRLAPPVAPPPPPKVLPDAAPMGRCTGREVAEMLDHGLPRTVIEKACVAP